jgi:hypothetical protein
MCASTRMSLNLEQSNRLWWSSWMHAVSSAVALSLHVYDLSLLSVIVLITSLNYWRHPDYGYRRYIDIVCVQIACWWLGIRNIDAIEPYRATGFVFGMITLFLFMTSLTLHRTHTERSTTLHSLVHVFGNIGSIIVYAGNLPAFSDSSGVKYLTSLWAPGLS